MKIVPFPRFSERPGEYSLEAQLEAALHGGVAGAEADSWRELREDVRALATPMSPGFERALRARIEQAQTPVPRSQRVRLGTRRRLALARAWLGSGLRPRLLAGSGICLCAAIAALVIVGPWRSSSEMGSSASFAGREFRDTPESTVVPSARSAAPTVSKGSGAGAVLDSAAPSAAGATSQPQARVQQRSATITLAATPDGVQSLADRVAALAVRDGGVVQSSQVRLQSGETGEASLSLSLPSARLSQALAELARLAPMRGESQGLQDITDEYDGARRELADIVAERQALLRALSRASTQGEIESLRARLSLVGGTISQARNKLQSISKRGSSSTVEVSVLGDAHTSSGGLTLGRGLHDAGQVLRTALAALLIALAVLMPLALIAGVSMLGRRFSQRRLRERALS